MFIRYTFIPFIYIIILSLQLHASTDYSRIDKHADAAAQQLQESIPALVSYLVEPASNDREKVRAIFRWISQNIYYDADSYFQRRLISEEPQQVIARGSAVCGGYARLFKQMCMEVAIPCEIISGWSKGYVEQLSDSPNHAWNAVKIENQWFLLDVTWGSGYINDEKRYVKSFQEHYFFTDPQLMIFDHLPEEKKWQLLDKPVSRSAFEELILLRPQFFKTGMTLISHKESNIIAGDELVVEFAVASTISVNGELIKNNQILPDHYVLSQRMADSYFVNVHFPDQGDYILRIYSKQSDEKLYRWACDYNIHVTEDKEHSPFVKQFSSFYDLDGFIYYPKDLILNSDQNHQFKIHVNNAKQVALLVNEKNIIPLEKSGNLYTVDVKPQAGPLRIMAKTDTTNTYQFLLEYQIK